MQLKRPAARWNGNICNNIIEDDIHQCHKFHLNIFGKYHHSPLTLHLYLKYIIKRFIVLVGILTLSKSEAKISQEFTEVPLPPLVPLVPLVGEDREVEAHRLVFPSRRHLGP